MCFQFVFVVSLFLSKSKLVDTKLLTLLHFRVDVDVDETKKTVDGMSSQVMHQVCYLFDEKES